MSGPQKNGPLSHIRVLDLSRIMAGPWAGQILADLGADVIKVERPGAGDDTRAWGPPFLKDKDGRETKEAGYYLSVNRGKRSITLNLGEARGQAVVGALAARSDIVLENFKVGTLARYGLGYDDMVKVKPDLIYCSITGFGQTGPRRDAAAYDFMIQAMSGLMSVTGEADGKPGGGPQKVGVPIIDIMSGMYAAIAVLAALARRAETGKGDYIDIGMLDVGVAFLANQATNYLCSGKVPRRTGNAHPNIQPQDVFPTADGHIAIVVGNDEQFMRFCDSLGQAALCADPRFTTNAGRVRHVGELKEILSAVLRGGDTQDWLARLEKANIPAAAINTVPEAFADPQVRHRQMVREIPHPLSGTVSQVVSPMRFAQAPLSFERSPPLLGQDTQDVLRELGL